VEKAMREFVISVSYADAVWNQEGDIFNAGLSEGDSDGDASENKENE
jgi:hypothetical protein